MAKSIIRPIASHAVRMNRGHHKHWAVGGSITITLGGCGHEQGRKLSQGLPKTGRVRCKECEQLRDGARPRTRAFGCPWVVHGWDEATVLPTLTELPGTESENEKAGGTND